MNFITESYNKKDYTKRLLEQIKSFHSKNLIDFSDLNLDFEKITSTKDADNFSLHVNDCWNCSEKEYYLTHETEKVTISIIDVDPEKLASCIGLKQELVDFVNSLYEPDDIVFSYPSFQAPTYKDFLNLSYFIYRQDSLNELISNHKLPVKLLYSNELNQNLLKSWLKNNFEEEFLNKIFDALYPMAKLTDTLNDEFYEFEISAQEKRKAFLLSDETYIVTVVFKNLNAIEHNVGFENAAVIAEVIENCYRVKNTDIIMLPTLAFQFLKVIAGSFSAHNIIKIKKDEATVAVSEFLSAQASSSLHRDGLKSLVETAILLEK